ncbi:hypothetical protein IKF88_01805 [Candidatus Saccharibacteria bacterium]|nr:hypothetical protein [Candidatus Saccharibacteria bacterium]
MKERIVKKRHLIPWLVVLLVLDVLLLIGSLVTYVILVRDYDILYMEDGTVETSVFLKDNEFYAENYRETSNEYVASLIDHIDADFKYNFAVSEEGIKISGDYDVVAVVDVLDKTSHNVIYNYKDTLVENTALDFSTNFSRTIVVDYTKYNDLIRRFIDVYDLDGTESTLTVKMRVNIDTDTNLSIKGTEKSSEISFSVPLTEKTVAVSINNNDVSNSDFLRVQQMGNKTPFLIFALIFLAIAVFDSIGIVYKIRKARTPSENYERELAKIMKDYSAFLQPISKPYQVKKAQIIEVETLEDLFEIRDSLQAPVLMHVSTRPARAVFVIPADEKNAVYRFTFSPADVK